MAIKCKVERLLTDVRARAQEHYEQMCRNCQGNYEYYDEDLLSKEKEDLANYQADVDEAMRIISASETSPVALYEHFDLFVVLDSDLFYNRNRYKHNGFKHNGRKHNGCKHRDSQLFLFRDSIYAATGPYTESECMLLVAELADKERTLFEALSQKQDSPEVREALSDRRRIPEKVRIAVWRRDQGQCARCSSRLNLEYDHIIPVAEGGGNTVRNIELLCEKCNRSKGKKIQ